MKFTKIKCTFLAIVMTATSLLTAACSLGGKGIDIVVNGKSDYVIVHGEKASVSERTAAKELQSYIEQMTGATLPIVKDNKKAVKKEIIIGKTNREGKNDFNRKELGDDGFVIKTKGEKLWLVGGEARGSLFAVYTFLEEYLGCRFYTETVEKVPETKNITVPYIKADKQIPVFMYRDMTWSTVSGAGAYTSKMKMNGFYAQPGTSYGGYYASVPGFVHTFSQIVGGSSKSQPCLTDPKNLEKAIRNVGSLLDTYYPYVKIIEISQNDNRNYCTCENCNKVCEEEGSQSGAIIRFVNAIAETYAEQYPDIIFQTLAYSYSQTAPKVTKPAKNVAVRLCPIYCCYSHAIDLETNDPERYESVKELLKGEIDLNESHRTDGLMDAENIVFMNDLRAWSEICDNIGIWQYSMNCHRTQLFFPNFNTILTNARLYADSNVTSVFDMGNGYNGGDFPELRAYITAKCFWDPYMTEEEYWALIDEFLEAVYGPGWQEIRNYIDNSQKLVEDVCCKCLSFDIKEDMRWDDFNCGYLFPAPEKVPVNPEGSYPEELTGEMIRDYENVDWSKYWNWYETLPEEGPVYLSYGKQCFANALALAETDAQRKIIEKTSVQVLFYQSWYNSQIFNVGKDDVIAMLEAYFNDHPGEFTEDEQNYYKDVIDELAEDQSFIPLIEYNKELYEVLKKYKITILREGKTINFATDPDKYIDFRIPPDEWI